MDTTNNLNGNSLGPDGTIRINTPIPPANDGDRTIVYDRQAQQQASEDTTLRTMKPGAAVGNVPYVAGDSFVLKGQNYRKISCLSDNSGEAQVFLVEHDGSEYVLKVYYPNFDINKKLLQTIHNFQFEMIMQLYDFGKTYVDGKHRYYELMEYLRGGTLQNYRLDGDFNQFRRIALQAAAALAYCHKNNILHKDIKPGNFFFRDERQRQLVLGDFGISSMLERDGKSYRTTQARTPIYAAPEMYADVIDGEVEITPSADYYSLGITLFAVWLGENPMSSNERVMMKQKNEGRLPRLNELPERVRMIVQGLTTVNPQSRWKYEEVERWFQGEDVPIDVSSPFLRYKSFIVDPDRNLVADNVHELIPLLVSNERLAQSYLYNGRIASWLESCGNTKLATAVKDIVVNRYPADQRAGLMAAVYIMEPTYPYRDLHDAVCDDIHGIALSLLSNQDLYALALQKSNDRLFIWLETHTKADVERLRSYFTPEADGRVALLKMAYEIDDAIPFLTSSPSSTVDEIIYAFGHGKMTDDEWKSLTDGRLLSWFYSHADAMACESLRILTMGQPYSQTLAYKVLYNIDRTAAYDLCDARTPEQIGEMLAERLKRAEHTLSDDFAAQMEDITDPKGRFYYYAQLHGWNILIEEATRCFDLKSEENRERLGAYDLRTAAYRFCRILGCTPSYLLPNGTLLSDGRSLSEKMASQIKGELRSGTLAQWLAVFYHEDPTKSFEEEYSYEHELEDWLMTLGHFDNQQQYYKRFVKAREDTQHHASNVRKEWEKSKLRGRFWRIFFYVVCAIWGGLVIGKGITGHSYFLYQHWALSVLLPVGGMLGTIVGITAFFKGYGFLMSVLWGSLGLMASGALLYLLRFVFAWQPGFFNIAVVVLTLLFMLIVHLTDYRNDNRHTDHDFVKSLLVGDDIKASLLDPLYYTFKTKSLRYKSAKFGVLDELSDQMRSVSGETSLHYALCSLQVAILIALFCLFSPSLLDLPLPGEEDLTAEPVMEQIDQLREKLQ